MTPPHAMETAHAVPAFHKPSTSDGARAATWAAGAPTRAFSLLTAAQLDALWSAVRGAARARTPPPAPLPSDRDGDACDDRPASPDASGAVLDYAAFRRAAAGAAARAGPAAARLMTARAFLRLAIDGEVDADALCDYLGQRAGQLQMHVHLSCFDADGDGWLTADEATSFVAATLPQLSRSGVGAAFPGALPFPDHAALAARKLVFFHGRRGRLRVRDVLAGGPLAELLDLASPSPPPPRSSDGAADPASPPTPPGGPPDNWFSASSAATAAAAFAAAAGGTGGVGAPALAALGDGTLSALFAARLIEERATTRAGLALADFIDFLLAWSARGHPVSVRWLWPALDVRGAGRLTRRDVETLFSPVRDLWIERGQYDGLRPADVASEVFDIVRPVGGDSITLSDLLTCPLAGTVVGLLADVGAFWEHDSRELVLQAAALGSEWEDVEEGDEEEDGGDSDAAPCA